MPVAVVRAVPCFCAWSAMHPPFAGDTAVVPSSSLVQLNPDPDSVGELGGPDVAGGAEPTACDGAAHRDPVPEPRRRQLPRATVQPHTTCPGRSGQVRSPSRGTVSSPEPPFSHTPPVPGRSGQVRSPSRGTVSSPEPPFSHTPPVPGGQVRSGHRAAAPSAPQSHRSATHHLSRGGQVRSGHRAAAPSAPQSHRSATHHLSREVRSGQVTEPRHRQLPRATVQPHTTCPGRSGQVRSPSRGTVSSPEPPFSHTPPVPGGQVMSNMSRGSVEGRRRSVEES